MTLNELLKNSHIKPEELSLQDARWFKNKFYLLRNKAEPRSTWALMIAKEIEREFGIDMNLADHPGFGGGGAGGNKVTADKDLIY